MSESFAIAACHMKTMAISSWKCCQLDIRYLLLTMEYLVSMLEKVFNFNKDLADRNYRQPV